MLVFFFKQKTAYEMRISDWSSACALPICTVHVTEGLMKEEFDKGLNTTVAANGEIRNITGLFDETLNDGETRLVTGTFDETLDGNRSEEHTSELQSLMRISYAVFSLKKQKQLRLIHIYTQNAISKK